jgi:hypothetical protein
VPRRQLHGAVPALPVHQTAPSARHTQPLAHRARPRGHGKVGSDCAASEGDPGQRGLTEPLWRAPGADPKLAMSHEA